MKHKLIAWTLILSLMTAVGCTRTPAPRTATDFALDTVIRVTVYDTDNDDIVTQSINLCKQYERIFSATIGDSDIGRLNAANGAPVTLTQETAELLALSGEYFALSDGLFDVTVAPITRLWDVTQDFPVIPKEKSLNNALAKVGYENLTLDEENRTASLTNGAQVDLGGIAKGYIADRITDFLKESGVPSAVIDLGGNVCVLGLKEGKPFRVGIAYPFSKDGELLGSLSVSDKAVVTSGVYQRYFRIDDQLYHHIFDPNTGYPAQTDLYSATILCDSAVRADALSTICILLGSERAIMLLQTLDDVDAVLIRSDGQVLVTSGFTQKYAPEFSYDYEELYQ